MRPFLALAALMLPLVAAPSAAAATGRHGTDDLGGYVSTHPGPGRFPIADRGRVAPIVVSAGDHAGVIRVADDLQSDLEKVTGTRPAVGHDTLPTGRDPIILGTLGKSPLIDRMVAAGRLDVRGLAGKWETTVEQIVEHPLPGVRRAFVIAGSDQRGTIYGAYDLSKRIGISPWHFWDDVPVRHRDALYALPGRHTQGTPAVRYRGFFINDENPATGTWAPGYFGPGKAPGFPNGLNAAYYAQVFETMLRLRANYLWPAVWGRAFAEDDPQNHATASYYGVVMGTSHEAPMMRGIEEWNRHAKNGTDPYGGNGEWSFRRNADAIKAYWRDGAERMAREKIEGVITLGMRGNGDVSLPDGDGIDLMSSIIDTQRQILRDTGLIGAPQVQTLYKEVQRYWDQGYRPPDDVTVVFCDDNWGNMRKFPYASMPKRSGGYGMYYHFDYVGGGRNYKWADTVNLTNTWEQLHRAYTSGIDRLWMVNVGDLKNEEEPTQFFLDYAWNPNAIPLHELGGWEKQYAAQNFGPALAPAIAGLLADYGYLQSRRKPELLNRRITLNPTTNEIVYDDQATPFSLTDYREMDRVTAEWQTMGARADRLRRLVPAAWQDAFYQLVYYQVKATANLYALRRAEFTNILYAAQGRASTNDLADVAEARFAEDQAMSDYYNTRLAGGKWKNWQLQPKIGYGNVERYGPNAPWQQPEKDNVALPDEIYPYLKRIEVPAAAALGVALDGGDAHVLPEFSPWQSQPQQYIDVFNKGATPFAYRITAGEPWVHVTPAAGRVGKEVRATVRVDWSRAPAGTTTVPITISGAGEQVVVQAPVRRPALRPSGFAEANGYVSMLAPHYTRKVGQWQVLPRIGKTGDGLTPLGGDGARLEYAMTLTTTGPVRVSAVLSPRNDALPTPGLRYAISVDDQAPQTVDVTAATGANATTMNRQWERNTSDNVNVTTTTHTIDRAGTHTLKFWMVDPTVILQKLVVDTGGVKYSYLGPPESRVYGR
ncbi:glycosyl hydrolase 115 family protein [Couchioplanes caeruleus]|uniref:glycosyl hydrolase 115 family protein n=1 Tax=Couchioplanes caeruleus TaxID=56438 RepID=UPI0020C15D76|nr:glycosyl hydrolase 115 family protein [Couchioplanes caeruleus]UQU62045.1 glycosyl hydrolase 115 family protein [Couchioplanes caeruleus]